MAQGSLNDPVPSLLNDGVGTPVPLGTGTAATSLPMVIASDQPAVASKNAATSQVDGHSASIGATTDADTANTVIGRIKQLLTRLPAALVGGRLDSNIGAWLGSTAPTVGQKSAANSIPVTMADNQPPSADILVSGNIAATNDVVVLNTQGTGVSVILITGTWVGTIALQWSNDGATWTAIAAFPSNGAALVTSTAVNGEWKINSAGFRQIRATATAWTSGTATVSINAGVGATFTRTAQGAPTATLAHAWPSQVVGVDTLGNYVAETCTVDKTLFAYPGLNRQLYHVNGTATISGSAVFNGYGAAQITLYINVKNSPTGTAPTIQYTIQEVDPGDNTTAIGPSVSSTVITAIGIQRITLPLTLGGNIKVTQTLGGTTPSFTGLYVTLVSKSGGITLADLGGLNVAKIDALGSLSTRNREDATFEVAGTAIALGNNKSMLSIFNADATVRLRVLAIWLVNTQTAAVTGVLATFELRRLTGAAPSAGTDLTTTGVEQHDTADVKNANWTVRTGATVGTESTKLLKRVIWSSDEYAAGAADVESADHAQQANIPIWERYDTTVEPIMLRQNEGLTVKCATNTTAGTWDVFMLVAQEA